MGTTSVILLLGIVQGVFLILILCGKSNINHASNRFLAMLLIAISSYLIYEFAEISLQLDQIKLLLKINAIAVPVVIGPSLFLFARSYLFKFKINQKQLAFHFLPYLILLFIVLFIEYSTGKINQLPKGDLPLFVGVIESFKGMHLFTYFLLTLLQLRTFSSIQKKAKYQNNAKPIIFWFKLLLSLFILSTIGSILFFVGIKVFDVKLGFFDPKYIGIVLVAIVYTIAYIVIRFPLTIAMENGNLIIQKALKYKTSPLTKNDKEKILARLVLDMEENKPYLDDRLKIDGLSNRLEIPSQYISQTINELCGKSFKDFINTYRVDEFKKGVLNSKKSNKTILAIAYEAGFASKSSFNRIFKSLTTLTPNEFKSNSIK